MDIRRNVKLDRFSSFRVGGRADYFVEANSSAEVQEALTYAKTNNLAITVLGGGSNILISSNGINGLVLLMNIKGLNIERSLESENDSGDIILKVGAGELWDDVVSYAVDNNFWGIENMSAVPGRTGAFAAGNVGAYGQEASQVLVNVDTVNLETSEKKTFYNQDMQFAYRKSIFNSSEKGKYIITEVTLKLNLEAKPNLSYKGVQVYFEKQLAANANFQPTLKEIRQAIISIRQEKLPDPKIIGNAGSFFKNIIANEAEFRVIHQSIKDNFGQQAAEKIASPPAEDDSYKISAAYLIELCGLKGFAIGGAQVYPNHALIITNTGSASATDIFNLAKHIRREVFAKTKVQLNPEPIFLGYTEEELQEFYNLT